MSVDIFYMLSFSRSGETLLQRHLAQCNGLKVGYDLYSKDSKLEIQLKKFLMDSNPSGLDREVANDFGIAEEKLLAKAIWLDNRQNQGFILVRHPFSIVSSVLANYSSRNAMQKSDKLARICGYVHPNYEKFLRSESSMDMLVVKVAQAWGHRMREAYNSGLPIVHYERFVWNPDEMLKKICNHLNVDCNSRVLNAYKAYQPGELGHGGITLSSPIDSKRAFANLGILSELQKGLIQYICAEPMDLFGYTERADIENILSALCSDRF